MVKHEIHQSGSQKKSQRQKTLVLPFSRAAGMAADICRWMVATIISPNAAMSSTVRSHNRSVGRRAGLFPSLWNCSTWLDDGLGGKINFSTFLVDAHLMACNKLRYGARQSATVSGYQFHRVAMPQCPRNQLNLRSARSSGGPFAFERNGKDSNQIATNVDLKFAILGRQDDLLHQRPDDVGGSHPLGLRILLKRGVQFVDLDAIVVRYVRVKERWRLFRLLQERLQTAQRSLPRS
ncbi:MULTISPECIES: hypothetical protein [unclassified Ochrobactrum]|uniref:hypothetical protein n=1 Tax=unclassified Ochrobactrum TaxID=239106 RepID=UPI00256FC634|nr:MULTISPECIES: hypothetical protein [unclassified Ochrobactrum]